jgi:16S rRNA (guanine527-N7)-methyltransferase
MTTATPDVSDDALAAGIAALALALPPGARAKLDAYLALLAKWNKTYNLTAIREPARMVTHHLLDALVGPAAAPPHGSVRACSMYGSGASVPDSLAIARPELVVC